RNGDGAAPLSRPRLVSRKAAPPPMSTPAQTHARNDVALGRLAGGVGGFCAMSLPRFRLYRPAVRWTPSHSGVVGVWAGPAGAERLVLVRRAVGFGPVARPLRRALDDLRAPTRELPGQQNDAGEQQRGRDDILEGAGDQPQPD